MPCQSPRLWHFQFVAVSLVLSTFSCQLFPVSFVLLIMLLGLRVTCTADLNDDMYYAVQLCIALPAS